MAHTTKAQAHRARMNQIRQEALALLTSTGNHCPKCGQALWANPTLAGTTWLQCLTPQSGGIAKPGNGCGWQILFETYP